MPPERAQEFYTTPWIAESLLEQFQWRYVTVRYPFGLRRHYDYQQTVALDAANCLWRPIRVNSAGAPCYPFFEIHEAKSPHAPHDLLYFVRHGAVEFIPEVSQVFDHERTDTAIIDLDPKGDFTWENVQDATLLVHEALCHPSSPLRKKYDVEMWKFRFSGNRSFHLYIRLAMPTEFKPLRDAVKQSLDAITLFSQHLTYSVADANGKILIDIGAIAKHRCVRSLWSLHHKTGRVCVPVDNVKTFDRDTATIDLVLARGPVKEIFL